MQIGRMIVRAAVLAGTALLVGAPASAMADDNTATDAAAGDSTVNQPSSTVAGTAAGNAAVNVAGTGSGSSTSNWGVQVGVGHANHHSDHVNKIDLAAVYDPHLTWWPIGGWHFGLVGELHAVYWHTNGNVDATIGEFGASPVLRFEKSSGAIRPYFEAGVGVRLLTHARISTGYTLSSAFQFADQAGFGAKFGARQQYQVGYRYQHLSNASIKRPNPGIDFHQVYVQYNFK